MFKTHWRFFIICLILIVVMIFRFHSGQIQQDNYLGYSTSLTHGLKDISFFDSRLFPGLPVIIYLLNLVFKNPLLCGYLAVFSAFIGSYIILYKLTGSVNSFIPLIFPPVMLKQTSLIATEVPVIFFILLSLYAFRKRKYALAILISAFGFWIRAVAVIPGTVIFIWLLIKNGKKSIEYLSYLLFPIILLALFNLHFFGSKEILHQFVAYRQLGLGTLGITQIFADIPRAWRWGWYRIFASGVFYFFLAIFIFTESFIRLRQRFTVFGKIVLVVILVSLLFIFSLNSVPFLENLGRYLAPVIPVFWLLFYGRFKNRKLVYLLLPISLAVALF